MDFRIAVKAVVVQEGKVLLIKRRTSDVHKPGQWDIPGGRLEIGENPWEGVRRETQEEVGISVKPLLPFDVHHFTRDDGQKITMLFFLCQPLTNEIVLSPEHTEYQWVALDNQEIVPPWLTSVLEKIKKFNLSGFVENENDSKSENVKHYDKLVRDYIPDIVRKDGSEPIIRIASEDEYWDKLKTKLTEEVQEFLQTEDKAELADILEVMDSIAKHQEVDPEEIQKIQEKKRTERGGFDQRIILVETRN